MTQSSYPVNGFIIFGGTHSPSTPSVVNHNQENRPRIKKPCKATQLFQLARGYWRKQRTNPVALRLERLQFIRLLRKKKLCVKTSIWELLQLSLDDDD